MNTEVFITCAITGGGETVGRHPAIPVTPKEIAAATLEATQAGAAIVHVHVRDPENGKPSRNPDLFVEVVDRIRNCGEDVVLNLTGGMGGDFVLGDIDENPMIGGKPGSDLVGPDERLVHVEKLRPDICSLDCGTMNFGDGNLIYVNSPLYLRRMAALLKAWNVKPELEVFDLGQLRFACQMLKEGLLSEPPIFQLCLGIPWGASADTHSMVAMADRLPDGSVWSAFGISRAQMPMVAQSVLLGGNVRVGLEDNLYLEKGVFASNGSLVERAVEIIERLGARVIGPEEARRKLGLVAS